MQLGIFARTFQSEDPLQALGAVQKAGFVCTQYNMACSGLASLPDEIDPGTAAAIGRASEETNIPVVAVSATFNMIHPDPVMRQTGLRQMETIAANARAMGTRLLTLCTGTRNPDDHWQGHSDNDSLRAWSDLLQIMEQAIAIADKHDIRLGMEIGLNNVVNSVAKAGRLIAQLQSDRLKIVLDPENFTEKLDTSEQKRLMSDAVEAVADHLAITYIRDRLPDGTFTAAGQGVLDYPHFLQALSDCGFDGPLVAHGVSAQEAPKVAKFLRKILKQIN